MLSGDSVWMVRAKLRQEARWQVREASSTQYLWPSGRCYRVPGDDVLKASLSCCASLHANRSEAVARGSIGGSTIGSAFFVEAAPGELGQRQLLAVTAADVIRDENIGDNPVLRIDHKNGKFQLIATSRRAWRMDEGENLAVIALTTPPLDFSYVPVSTQAFVTREFMQQKGFGVGHTIFVPQPSLRSEKPGELIFGNITRMPGAEDPHRRRDLNGLIAIELHSAFGRPGSPVFLGDANRASQPGSQLLGVYLGPVEDECLVVSIWKLAAILEQRSSDGCCDPEEHVFVGGYQSSRRRSNAA